MLQRFAKKYVGVTANYICKCGHKFTRKNTDWFTMSPFNTLSETETRKQLSAILRDKVRPCPKCKKSCKPNK